MDPLEQIVKRLMTTVKCTVCGSKYESDKVNVLGHQEELWFLTVTCSNCHTQGLVAALIKGAGESEPATASIAGVESDSASPEPKVTPEKAPAKVTADDVLDMHSFLDGFDGDFRGLFTDEGGA